MICGLDADGLPDHWTPLEAVTVVKCLDDEGDVALAFLSTSGLTLWEAVGMLTAALDANRASMAESFETDEADE